MSLYIDSHAHLDDERFDLDIREVIKRAESAGVNTIINNGINFSSNRKTLKLSDEFPIIKPALGVYPCEIDKFTQEEIWEEIKFIEEHKDEIVAIGEVGLDNVSKDIAIQPDEQKWMFSEFIKLAEEIKKPLIVHSRGSENEVFSLLEKSKARVVMHCYTGKLKLADEMVKKGYFFSIPTSVVYSKQFQDLVKAVPITQILTETDCPFFHPEKKERNEPQFIPEAVKKIAEIKGMTPEEVEKSIFMNFQRLFL